MKPTNYLLFLPEYRVDSQMGGIGVRALDLAYALSNTGSVVVLSSHHNDLGALPFSILCADDVDEESLLRACDVVFFFDLGKSESLLRAVELDRFIVIENAIPIEHLEYNNMELLAERADRYEGYVSGFRLQLLAGDHFLARSLVERTTLVACLALAGRILPQDVTISRTLTHLVTLVPIGFARQVDETYIAPPSARNLVLWTGGLWDYMAPETALAAFAEPSLLSGNVELGFLHGPSHDQALQATSIFNSLVERSSRVWIASPAPNYFQRILHLTEAKAFLCLGRPGIENETCVRLRVRDSLLYRRPLIVDPYGATADYVYRTGIGLVARSLEPQDISDSIQILLKDSAIWTRCVAAIETERRSCVVDYTLAPLLHAGFGSGWQPGRTSIEKLAAMKLEAGNNHPSKIRLPFKGV